MKYFPVDIFAVKKYGIEKWQNEFFWPVSDKDFVNFSNDIEQCMVKRINDEPEDIGDLLIIQRGLPVQYWHILHALKVIDEIKSRGLTVLFSDDSFCYRDLLTDGAISLLISKIRENRCSDNLYRDVFFTRIKNNAKNLLRSFEYNLNLFKFFNPKCNGEISILYGSADSLMRHYIRKLKNWVYVTSKYNWLPKKESYNISEKSKVNIKRVSSAIADDLKSIANRNGIKILDIHVNYLVEFTQSELINTSQMLHLIKDGLIDKNKIHLLISGLTNAFHRTLAIAVRERGGKVTSFNHGGHIGLYDTYTLAFSEFSLANEFVTHTPESVKLFERIKSNHTPFRNNKVNIISCASKEFFKMRGKYKDKPLPINIKRIMIIGYPHNQWRKPQGAATLSLMQLDFELRLIDILKKSGYYVIYKVHPDRVSEVKGIFEDKAEVISGYFEDCLDIADVFLFGSIRTTAFPIALCTNKPIIGFVMKSEFYKPFPEPMELLKKRCNIIYTDFDERNRIIFNKAELLDALAKPPKKPNNEFLEKYMFL